MLIVKYVDDLDAHQILKNVKENERYLLVVDDPDTFNRTERLILSSKKREHFLIFQFPFEYLSECFVRSVKTAKIIGEKYLVFPKFPLEKKDFNGEIPDFSKIVFNSGDFIIVNVEKVDDGNLDKGIEILENVRKEVVV